MLERTGSSKEVSLDERDSVRIHVPIARNGRGAPYRTGKKGVIGVGRIAARVLTEAHGTCGGEHQASYGVAERGLANGVHKN
jgi:hypothetical protein